MSLQKTLLRVALPLILLAGCCSERRGLSRLPREGAGYVYFPPVQLLEGEFIQSFKLTVTRGWIDQVQKVPHDWDISVRWEHGGLVVAEGNARHFSAGLPSARLLNNCFGVQFERDAIIQAVLTTERTDPAGGGGRKLPFCRLQVR